MSGGRHTSQCTEPVDEAVAALFSGLVRHAIANQTIWKSWRCRNCGEKHPPEQLLCDKIRPHDEAAGT